MFNMGLLSEELRGKVAHTLAVCYNSKGFRVEECAAAWVHVWVGLCCSSRVRLTNEQTFVMLEDARNQLTCRGQEIDALITEVTDVDALLEGLTDDAP